MERALTVDRETRKNEIPEVYYQYEQISEVGIGGVYSTLGADESMYIILFGKAKVKRLLTAKWHMWSSGQSSWLQILTSRIRFPALPYFLRSTWVWNGVHSAS
jgi:hypothetical protein